jgi:hypothetical protein
MILHANGEIPSAAKSFWKCLMIRLAVVVLLVTVAGLSTLAKDGQYGPRTSPERHVSLSTKMNVAAPVVFNRQPSQPVVHAVPAPPPVRAASAQDFEDPLIEKIGWSVSMQHRSPPFSLA